MVKDDHYTARAPVALTGLWMVVVVRTIAATHFHVTRQRPARHYAINYTESATCSAYAGSLENSLFFIVHEPENRQMVQSMYFNPELFCGRHS